MSGIAPREVLTILRLRQWAYDRCKLRSGQASNPARNGWAQRRLAESDAAIVRVIDFEHALGQLPPEEQAVLIGYYADGQDQSKTAHGANCSVRKVAYLLPAARQHLADVLDRCDLL